MSELRPMSAADYRANAQKVNDQRPTEIVKLKSGSVFELRRPNLSAYMVTGRLPQSLVSVGMKAWKKGPEQVATDLNDDEAMETLIFMREIVHECTVRPKFVQFATNDDEISASEMLIEDFNEIFSWAMGYQGVAGINGLQSFLQGRTRGTAGVGSNSKKQRRKGKRTLEAVGTVQ